MEGLWGMLYFIPISIVLTLTPASNSPISTVWHEDFIDSFVQVLGGGTGRVDHKRTKWVCQCLG